MKKPFIFLMRAFYANDTYSKYKSWNTYYGALTIGTFFVLVTLLLVTFIALAISPSLYRLILIYSSKINSKLFGVGLFGAVFFLLRITIKEDAIKGDSLTKEEVARVVNYCIGYVVTVGVIIVFLGLKFLRHYKNAI